VVALLVDTSTRCQSLFGEVKREADSQEIALRKVAKERGEEGREGKR